MIDTDKYERMLKATYHSKTYQRKLLMHGRRLIAEVKRLREWKAEVERICRTMNGPNRDTALFIMTNEVEEE